MKQKYSAYQKEFGYFLSRTNEKEVFAKLIVRFMKQHHVRSLLDIGAGEGRLAWPVAKNVRTYLAVEQNPIFAQKLRHHGLRVVSKPFPCALDRTFDMVLLSHVLRADDQWKKIMTAARRLLAPTGYLMIVMHQSRGSEWVRFKAQLGYTSKNEHIMFARLLAYLQSMGAVRVHRVLTYLSERDADSFMRSLAYIRGDDSERRRHGFFVRLEKHKSLIMRQYYRHGRYRFPIEHVVIEAGVKGQKS
jgi:ubiquinone/menaquinone biosynthesis C-methylase UbiE